MELARDDDDDDNNDDDNNDDDDDIVGKTWEWMRTVKNFSYWFFFFDKHARAQNVGGAGGVIPFDRYNQFVVSSKPTWKKILKTKAVYR